MKDKIQKDIRELYDGFFSSGSFTQNFAVTLSGNLFAQILGFLFTPFIARVYGPEAYGIFALFIGIANNLAPLNTLQFPSGYAMVRDDQEFRRLVQLTCIWLMLFTALISASVLIFGADLLGELHADNLHPFLFFFPLYFLFMGIDEILLGWNIRVGEFKQGAISRVISVTLSKGTTLLWGIWAGPIATGIVLGNLLQYPVDSIMKSSRTIRIQLREVFRIHGIPELRSTLKKFSSFPFFVMPGLMVSNLGSQLPIYFFTAAYSPEVVGLFALSSSLVMLPLNLLVNSSTAVFLRKSSETYQKSPDQFKIIVNKLYNRLFWVSLLPLSAFAVISEFVVSLLFGERWLGAGQYAGILALGSVFCASSFTLSVIYRQLGKEHRNFSLNVFFVLLKFMVLIWCIPHYGILITVIAYSVATMISYVINLVSVFVVVGLPPGKIIRDAALTAVVFAAVLFIIL